VHISGLTEARGPVTLGFRAEDATITDGEGQIQAPVYTVELLGDATMVTVRAGSGFASVKAPKDYRVEIGEPVSIAVPMGVCHLFDASTGARLAPR